MKPGYSVFTTTTLQGEFAHLIGQGLNQNIIVPINLPATLLDMQINGAQCVQ